MTDVFENPIVAGPDWQPGDPLYAHPNERRARLLNTFITATGDNERRPAGREHDSIQYARQMAEIRADHEIPSHLCTKCTLAGDDLIVVE